jgi:transposase InsO family protein
VSPTGSETPVGGPVILRRGGCEPSAPSSSALDYQYNQTSDGRMLRLLNIVDEFTREALVMHVGRSITAEQTVTVLQALVAERGCPENVRCDNGPELTAHALRDWCTSTSVTTSYMSRARRGRTRSRNPSTLVFVSSC